jgi:tripartite-type tricarboxylate transporter receptor subunit TctC
VRIISSFLALASFALAGPVQAQDWPQRQVTIVVPFNRGGSPDMFGRLLADGLEQKFGKPFVVENRAGASGNFGANAVARAMNDGYTLLIGTVDVLAINPFISRNLPYDAERDLQPVSLIARLPNILVVNPTLPAKTIPELIDHLKKYPGQLSYGSTGVGTSAHLAAELFQIKTGTKMVHVPFRSSREDLTAVIGNQVDLAFDNISTAWPQVKAGKLRALAVTSAEPSSMAAGIPTVAATLPGFEATSWDGILAPARTPRPIVDRIAAEVKTILDSPELQKTMGEVGAVYAPLPPEQFAAFIAAERSKWQEVVRAANIKGP